MGDLAKDTELIAVDPDQGLYQCNLNPDWDIVGRRWRWVAECWKLH